MPSGASVVTVAFRIRARSASSRVARPCNILPGRSTNTGQSSLDTWAYRVALDTALAWRGKTALRSQKTDAIHGQHRRVAG